MVRRCESCDGASESAMVRGPSALLMSQLVSPHLISSRSGFLPTEVNTLHSQVGCESLAPALP